MADVKDIDSYVFGRDTARFLIEEDIGEGVCKSKKEYVYALKGNKDKDYVAGFKDSLDDLL